LREIATELIFDNFCLSYPTGTIYEVYYQSMY
jgi:hypothetical protein